MTLVKSLLLGSVAGLAAVASAQAADLPFRKAAPVDYVRVCDWVGQAGYFYIPGTDTCIKLGGEVRFEYGWVQPKTSFYATPFSTLGAAGFTGNYVPRRVRSDSGFFARGKLEADVRTQTAYGLLRTFVRIQSDRYSGNYNSGGAFSAVGQGSATIPGGSSSATYLDKGYITFAGITAGRIQSFFDFYADDYNYEGIANSDQSTQVLAYTASFGGGFSATISVEDANVRRDGVNSIAFGNTAIGPNALVGAAGGGFANGAAATYAGQRYPDAVAQINWQQAWGSVQISGAYHDINTLASVGAANVPGGIQSATASGFAVQAGVNIKLPMIAAGDEIWLEGAYQNGAYSYMDSGANFNSGFYGSNIGGFQHLDADAIAIGNGAGTGYRLALSDGFSVMGAFHHYFTPQFHDVLYGSYEEVGYGSQARNIDWTRGGLGDASEYRIGNQFIFTPVHNLDLGVDLMYAKINQDLAHERGFAPTALPAGIAKDPDSFQVRLRVDRNF